MLYRQAVSSRNRDTGRFHAVLRVPKDIKLSRVSVTEGVCSWVRDSLSESDMGAEPSTRSVSRAGAGAGCLAGRDGRTDGRSKETQGPWGGNESVVFKKR